MSGTGVDLAGQPLTEAEVQLVELYDRTKLLLERDDLAPCVHRNVVQCAAALNQAVNDLGIAWEMLYDLGV
jgi:hypothetical protein